MGGPHGRGFESLAGRTIRVRGGQYNGYRGRVKHETGTHVQVGGQQGTVRPKLPAVTRRCSLTHTHGCRLDTHMHIILTCACAMDASAHRHVGHKRTLHHTQHAVYTAHARLPPPHTHSPQCCPRVADCRALPVAAGCQGSCSLLNHRPSNLQGPLALILVLILVLILIFRPWPS